MLMFKCLKGLAPAYLVAFCTKGSAVSGRSALRSAVRGDLVVPGPSCWNELPVELRDLTVGPATFEEQNPTLNKCVFKDALVQSWFFLIKHVLLSLCNIL